MIYKMKFEELIENHNVKLKVTLTTGNWGDGDWGGTYFCVWWTAGKSTYVPFTITMIEQPGSGEELDSMMNEKDEEDRQWLETRFGLSYEDRTVLHARTQCEGNKACMLSVLQRQALGITESCWWCLQMDRTWKAHPLKSQHLNELKGLISCGMWETLRLMELLRNGSSAGEDAGCTNPMEHYTGGKKNVWAVKPQVGDMCRKVGKEVNGRRLIKIG